MIDLYLFNTIINTIWYIFTILFLLYRFTSFFSYIYNFIRFCGKLFTGVHYVYDQIRIYIRKRRGFTNLSSDDESNEYLLPGQNTRHKTIFETCRDYVTKQYDYYYYKIFGKPRKTDNFTQNDTYIQLTETSLYSTKNESGDYYISKEQEIEKDLFTQQLNDLCANGSSIDFNAYIEKYNQSKQYQSQYDRFNYDKSQSSQTESQLFETVVLNGVDENEFDKRSKQHLDMSSSNMLFDTQFIKRSLRGTNQTQSTQTELNKSTEPIRLIIHETYPKQKSVKRSKLSLGSNIPTIEEEDEQEDEQEDKDGKIVYNINSDYKLDFNSVNKSEEDSEEDSENKSEYNNKNKDGEHDNNRIHGNSISYSLLKENTLDDYTSEILRNPYI